jgi:hypothetical protein
LGSGSSPTTRTTSSKLKDLSLVIVDTLNHDLASHAIRETVKRTGITDVVVFSDKKLYDNARHIQVPPMTGIEDYSHFMLKGLVPYINTDHFLVIQYDGYVANENEWTDEFLEYDYIGAPWSGMWGKEFDVGNGGFSLRSKKLINALQDDDIQFDLNMQYGTHEDVIICVIYRKMLEEKYGIKFGTRQLAEKFSIEIGYKNPPPFGFHSSWQIPLVFDRAALMHYIDKLDVKSMTSTSQLGLFASLAGSDDFIPATNLYQRYKEAGPFALDRLKKHLAMDPKALAFFNNNA